MEESEVRRVIAALITAAALCIAVGTPESVYAQDPFCRDNPQLGAIECIEVEVIPYTPTPGATSTPVVPTATATPTRTSVPPSATPVTPTATSVPATPVPAGIDINTLPKETGTGRVHITTPGTYRGSITCQNVPSGQYCLHTYASGIVLQDFSVTSPSGTGAIHTGSGVTFRRGTITGQGGITGHQVTDILIDDVDITATVGTIGIYDAQEGCETLTTKRTNRITIRNSSFINLAANANESVWMKCTQNVRIENNYFRSGNQWNLSLPDSLDVIVRGNIFDLTPAYPPNWLGIELPRVNRALVELNSVQGPTGDTFVYVNSGTANLTLINNCVPTGIHVISLVHQPVVAGLVNSGNGPCGVGAQPFTPPTTGDAGLR